MSPNTRLAATSALMALALSSVSHLVLAQGDHPGLPGNHENPCTNATAAGTYGYRMNGVIVGVGPFLVNGIFTHAADGTMSADVELVVGNASLPLLGTNGTFETRPDCTGSGQFATPLPGLSQVTYNFLATDGGDQIELLNTNAFVVLQGAGRRISKADKAPRCDNSQILGSYGYRLEGSLPGVPNVAAAGIFRHQLETPQSEAGTFTGGDTLSLMGTYVPRTFAGVFSLASNCRGTGSYQDSLGQTIHFVFTAVNDGDTFFLQGTDPGAAIHGVAQRMR